MKKLISRRQRMLRTRDVQHRQALGDVAIARMEAKALEQNAERLQALRNSLLNGEAASTGAHFASYRELAMRLDQAGKQLEGAIHDARRVVADKENLRFAANVEREVAARLTDRARESLDAHLERRLQSLPRAGRKPSKGMEA